MFWIFRCLHRKTTFPLTSGKGDLRITTVQCTDCGKRIHYDWETMKQGAEVVEVAR